MPPRRTSSPWCEPGRPVSAPTHPCCHHGRRTNTSNLNPRPSCVRLPCPRYWLQLIDYGQQAATHDQHIHPPTSRLAITAAAGCRSWRSHGTARMRTSGLTPLAEALSDRLLLVMVTFAAPAEAFLCWRCSLVIKRRAEVACVECNKTPALGVAPASCMWACVLSVIA